MTTFASLPLVCPVCYTRLIPVNEQGLMCQIDGRVFRSRRGIWRFLLPDRAKFYARFLHEYEVVRLAEGRGATDPNYYLRLPVVDRSDRFKADWDMRAHSFDTFIRRVVHPMENTSQAGLNILDLGAGNGWLSNRLAQRGHSLAAVDLRTGTLDGLGAVSNYQVPILAVQAEFNRLPFEDSLFDLVVFNASMHYAQDYSHTIREALRVMRENGGLVIVDTPFYQDAASGKAMVREREDRFQAIYGFPSNAVPLENFLIKARLKSLGHLLDIQWQLYWPAFGLRWRLRRWKAGLGGHREPANFPVILGHRRRAGSSR